MIIMTSIHTDNFVQVLTQAAVAYREQNQPFPHQEEIVNALLAAETTAKQQRINYHFASLLGKWRLCFATGTKKARERGGIILVKGWYVPKLVKIHISFNQTSDADCNQGEIANQVLLGGILLKLTGPLKYLGKKNILAFDFHQMLISLFNRKIYQQQIRSHQNQSEDFNHQPVAKLPFFAFFLVTEDLIAARGRGGGLALWIRE